MRAQNIAGSDPDHAAIADVGISKESASAEVLAANAPNTISAIQSLLIEQKKAGSDTAMADAGTSKEPASAEVLAASISPTTPRRKGFTVLNTQTSPNNSVQLAAGGNNSPQALGTNPDLGVSAADVMRADWEGMQAKRKTYEQSKEQRRRRRREKKEKQRKGKQTKVYTSGKHLADHLGLPSENALRVRHAASLIIAGNLLILFRSLLMAIRGSPHGMSTRSHISMSSVHLDRKEQN